MYGDHLHVFYQAACPSSRWSLRCHQSLTEQLVAAGFDQKKSTVFTLEGVSQYIPKEALVSTLKEVAELAQSKSITFYLSYVDQALVTNPKACFGVGYPKPEQRANSMRNLSAKVGEPWISFLFLPVISSQALLTSTIENCLS